jgi:hypothetical protein
VAKFGEKWDGIGKNKTKNNDPLLQIDVQYCKVVGYSEMRLYCSGKPEMDLQYGMCNYSNQCG